MIDIETSNSIQKQMLDKMDHYREMLRCVLRYMYGSDTMTRTQILEMISDELKLNPKWEVLNHLPHGTVIHGPDAYKAINTGPKPK